MDAERLELEVRRLAVSQLVESCYETAQRRAAEKDLTLSLQLPGRLPDIAGDTRRLQEVLQNLLDNAIQYTLPGGKIVLSSEAKNDEVIFTVADTGIGIPRSDQPRIFERFYRVDAARSREAGGTGLGLVIAKHLIEVHGGRIWVESEVGEGSQFHFSIPVFDPERVATRTAVSAAGSRASRGTTRPIHSYPSSRPFASYSPSRQQPVTSPAQTVVSVRRRFSLRLAAEA